VTTQPEVVIIGAGPAGIAAAIQLRRYNTPFVLLEKERVGGLLWNANMVENYPGFASGITGPDLVGLLEEHLESAGVEVVFEEVMTVDVDNAALVVRAGSSSYAPRAVLVASGTTARPFPVHVPATARDRVFATVGTILMARGKQVVVVGAGDAALDYALNLLRHNAVTLLNRGIEIQGLPLLWERARSVTGFQYHDQISVTGISGPEGDGSVTVHCESLGTNSTFSADYVVFALGREPQAGFVSKRAREQECTLLECGQLHFIGDVRNGLLRQTAIAVGDGVRAAMQISGIGSKR
jgi:thioredoxin reductase (NADPH)